MRFDESGQGQVLYLGTYTREEMRNLQATYWTDRPEVLACVPKIAENVLLREHGRARELVALSVDADPDIQQLIAMAGTISRAKPCA